VNQVHVDSFLLQNPDFEKKGNGGHLLLGVCSDVVQEKWEKKGLELYYPDTEERENDSLSSHDLNVGLCFVQRVLVVQEKYKKEGLDKGENGVFSHNDLYIGLGFAQRAVVVQEKCAKEDLKL
jgi:hypothetical protein